MSNRTRYLLFRLLYFVVQMPIGIAVPFFVLYLRNEMHFDARQISLITGITGVTIILFQQVWGYVADLAVSRRKLLVFNSLGAGIAFYAIGASSTLGQVFVLTFIYSILATPILQFVNGFLFTFPDGPSRFGGVRAYASLGFIVANLVTGIIADHWTHGRLHFLFPAFWACSAAAGLIVLLIPGNAAAPKKHHTFLEVQAHFLGKPEVAIFLGGTFFYQAAHSLSYAYQSFVMQDMGADMRMVSISYIIGPLLEIPVFFAANFILKRFGEVRLMIFAALVQACRWMLVWAARTPEDVILVSISHCITFGVFYACAVSFMNRHAGEHFKASAQTMYALVYLGFAGVFGNYVGGQVISGGALAGAMNYFVNSILHLPDRGGIRNLYVFCSAMAAISALIFLVLLMKEKRLVRAPAAKI
jgi:PPP family 3-phenylpropionic acid transporter